MQCKTIAFLNLRQLGKEPAVYPAQPKVTETQRRPQSQPTGAYIPTPAAASAGGSTSAEGDDVDRMIAATDPTGCSRAC